MLRKAVIEHFGTQKKAAEVLGITKSAVNQWRRELIPEHWAARLHALTHGELRYDPSQYDRKRS